MNKLVVIAKEQPQINHINGNNNKSILRWYEKTQSLELILLKVLLDNISVIRNENSAKMNNQGVIMIRKDKNVCNSYRLRKHKGIEYHGNVIWATSHFCILRFGLRLH